MLHEIARFLVEHGHTVRVIAQQWRGAERTVDGVTYQPPVGSINRLYRSADVLVTHLDLSGRVDNVARQLGKPTVHLVHNDRQLAYFRVVPRDSVLAVFNSRWLQRKVEWAAKRLVVHPRVRVREYERSDGPHDAVTLVNMFASKGTAVLAALAERLPAQRFLAVKGAYGLQQTVKLPNVEVVGPFPHIADVLAETAVLVVPSTYESWGRVAVEAMAHKCAVVAAPTPGLVESVGCCAYFADVDDPDLWEAQVSAALTYWDPAPGYRRAVELEDKSVEQMERLERALVTLSS